MNITQDKSQVMEIYCDWLQKNCDRYEYLTSESENLYQKLKNMDIQSIDSKEYYLQFLSMFVNNPFIAASSCYLTQSTQNTSQIISSDFRCYFIKNKFGMWVPLELYCRLVVYKDYAELDRMLEDQQNNLKWADLEFASQIEDQTRMFEAFRARIEKEFVGFFKGNGEITTHAFVSLINLIIVISACRLWVPYVRKGMSESNVFIFKVSVVVFAAALLYIGVQNILDISNRQKKKKVQASVRKIEQLEKVIQEGNEKTKTLTENLSEFLTQILRADKNETLDGEILKKGMIPIWSREEGKQYQKETGLLEMMPKKLVSHTKWQYFLIALVIHQILLVLVGFSPLLNISLPKFQVPSLFSSQKHTAETTAAASVEEEEDEGNIWVITAGECNLQREPDGDVITTIPYGEQVTAKETDDTGIWMLVDTSDGTEGWISRRVAKKIYSNEIPITDAEASSELHTKNSGIMEVRYAVDGNLLTSWQEGVEGYGIGETITIYFDDTTEVKQIMFVNGNAKTEEAYYQNGRVKSFSVYSPDMDEEYTFDIEDFYSLEGSWFDFEEPLTGTELILTIEDVYEGSKYQDTCIADIGLFGE